MTPAVNRMWTSVLITVGALLAGLCGSCTAYFLVVGAADNTGYGPAILVFAAMVGILPTVIGALLLWWGLRRRKRARTPRTQTDVF